MILTSKIILFSSLFFIVMSRHLDFRERFLERKRLRALNDQRVTILNKLANTVILDDITHYRKLKGQFLKKIRAIEKDFRRLLAMDGMKYNYKRDLFWRTWRSIPPVNGATKEIVCYKCNNLKHANGTTSPSCGTWTIEDNIPPCPFEFYSVQSDESFCGANISQYKDVKHKCPTVIKFSDLTATCDNPIETQWRFTKMYGVTEEHDNVICKNQDFCEIFTSYEIRQELVVFRIINSTNDVIYSRIMKPKNKNYVCIEDCGHFNPETRKITKANSNPLKLDLFTSRKMKRNDLLHEILAKKELLKKINENISKREDVLNGKNENVTKRDLANKVKKSFTKREDLLNGKNENVIISDFLNGKNENVTKRDYLNKMNKIGKKKETFKEIARKRGKLNNSQIKRDFLNKMNKNVTKRKENFKQIVKKREKLNDRETKRAVLKKANDSGMKRDKVLNEINKSDAKEDLSNETSDCHSKTDELLDETNDSDENEELLLNEMNDSDENEDVMNDTKHLPSTKRAKLLNELLPMEENLSTLDWGGSAFDLVSVEVNALHNIKSRGKQINFTIENEKTLPKPKATRQRLNTLASIEKQLDSLLHKPTVTPHRKMKKKEDYISYDDDDQELEYL